jgi:acyl-CoA synthetase (AMP-forming)/AMP-acid ligase II
VDLEIRTASGARAPTGEIGRVWIRGPGVISSYVDGRTSERFDEDGWLDTGDVGSLDADGYLYLAGRADDVINRGGELVYPREIEEVLLSEPDVLDAVVVGRADDILGAVPAAYVIPRPSPRTEEDNAELLARLERRCHEQLSRFKRPAYLILVDELPRAATGKIRRHRVAAEANEASVLAGIGAGK